jgi:hypothetical protein
MRRSSLLVAVLAAALWGLGPAAPAGADGVHVAINIGASPRLVVVPGMPVYYAPALPHNYFFYGGQYYLFHNGGWFFASSYNGPWAAMAVEYVPRPILAVPVQYYNDPPAHWKGHGPPPWAPAWGHRKKRDREDD